MKITWNTTFIQVDQGEDIRQALMRELPERFQLISKGSLLEAVWSGEDRFCFDSEKKTYFVQIFEQALTPSLCQKLVQDSQKLQDKWSGACELLVFFSAETQTTSEFRDVLQRWGQKKQAQSELQFFQFSRPLQPSSSPRIELREFVLASEEKTPEPQEILQRPSREPGGAFFREAQLSQQEISDLLDLGFTLKI